nr:uncharacterized protein LOC129263284 [Lytechinus pictus]
MSAPYPDKAQEAVYPPQQPEGYAPVPQNQGYPPQGYPPQGAPPAYPQGQAQYAGGQNVIVATAPQTTMIVRQSQPQPNDYLAFAIFVTICCCLPFGIVGIVKSMDVSLFLFLKLAIHVFLFPYISDLSVCIIVRPRPAANEGRNFHCFMYTCM